MDAGDRAGAYHGMVDVRHPGRNASRPLPAWGFDRSAGTRCLRSRVVPHRIAPVPLRRGSPFLREFRMLHDTSEVAARRAKAPYASFARGRCVLLLGFAVVSLVSISLPGCSAQRGAARMRDAQDQKAFLSSERPAPNQTSYSLGEIDYDPWESFNERTFYFNFHSLERYGLK